MRVPSLGLLVVFGCSHVAEGVAVLRPSVTLATPADGVAEVQRDVAIALEVSLPNVGAGVDATTLMADHVVLLRDDDHAIVPTRVKTSGGGDVIVIRPVGLLAPMTRYTLQVTDGVTDVTNAAFVPFTASFTTTSVAAEPISDVAFTNVVQPAAAGFSFTSLAVGPDGKLYAGSLEGPIVRYAIAADGTLSSPHEIATLGASASLGLVFDPAATAGDPILWVTHGPPLIPPVADFSDKLTRLTGPDLATAQDIVVGLPHSIRDHATNSIAFGPDGALYIMQGSNTATGAPDNAWGLRTEHVLNAAVLRLDVGAITTTPLDVKTEAGGTYDPSAPGAPLTLYATGIRNGFDLVWHHDGQLYVANNGSAAGGASPATPDVLPAACARRTDGTYTGPAVPRIATNPTAQHDYLYAVERGRYYGHPNPTRCEWVLNGGNPTAGSDIEEAAGYPVGVLPDRNFARAAFDFGLHQSPDGMIEYKSNTFGGALKGKLLVTRYSSGGDVVVLSKASVGFTAAPSVPGLDGLDGPVDVVENPRDGSLYVSELNAKRITLFKPTVVVPAPHADVWPAEIVASSLIGTITTATVNVGNSGDTALHLGAINVSDGAWTALAMTPFDVIAGGTMQVNAAFAPVAPACGPLNATARVVVPGGMLETPLFGLTFGCASAEPTLQQVLDTVGFPVRVGAMLTFPTDPEILGDEVHAPWFVRAGDGPVEVSPLARFGPIEDEAYGWFTLDGTTPNARTLSTMLAAGAQTLNPPETATVHGFDPGPGPFGLFTTAPGFMRTIYSPDDLNSHVAHAVRVYPAINRAGVALPYRYVVAFEEATNGDYQDVVLFVSNVIPAP